MNLNLPEAQPASTGTSTARAETAAPRLLARIADLANLRFNGCQPWDIQVLDPALYRRVLTKWSLGLGEAYVDGLWDAERLDETLDAPAASPLAATESSKI